MEEFNNSRKETMLFLIITLVLLLIGVLLRIAGLQTRNLEYDEIWTFAHYVKLPFGEMFSDLATPNNHPLNSLVIKYFKLLNLPQLLQIRLGVFLAGILLLIVTGLGLRRLTRSLPGICCGVLLLALNIPLIRYSQTARGYEFQALFTVCVMFSLLFFEMDLKQPLRRILWAAHYMRSRCRGPLTAGETAKACGLSVSRFLHLFRRETGYSFSDWLQRLRVAAACRLLEGSPYKLAEIAEISGIRDQSRMTYLFRRYLNTTPGKWRRKKNLTDGSAEILLCLNPISLIDDREEAVPVGGLRE